MRFGSDPREILRLGVFTRPLQNSSQILQKYLFPWKRKCQDSRAREDLNKSFLSINFSVTLRKLRQRGSVTLSQSAQGVDRVLPVPHPVPQTQLFSITDQMKLMNQALHRVGEALTTLQE